MYILIELTLLQNHALVLGVKSSLVDFYLIQCNLDYPDHTLVQGSNAVIYRISEIVRITEVLTIFSFFDVPWYKTALVLQRKLQKDS